MEGGRPEEIHFLSTVPYTCWTSHLTTPYLLRSHMLVYSVVHSTHCRTPCELAIRKSRVHKALSRRKNGVGKQV